MILATPAISNRKKLYFVLGLFILVILFSLGVIISRIGKTVVTLTVIPTDASVRVNGQSSSSGDLYLTPGKYTFNAHKSGFSDDTQTLDIGQDPVSVGLIPAPTSDSALSWLQKNPDIQKQREAIGGVMSGLVSKNVIKTTPILSYLPYTDIAGPFTIDFGSSKNRQYGTFLQVNLSSPQGRENALKWIRSKGYNPTDLEIRYADFANPLLPVDSQEKRVQ